MAPQPHPRPPSPATLQFRTHILTYLETHPSATTTDIAIHLNHLLSQWIEPRRITSHLKALAAQSLVTRIPSGSTAADRWSLSSPHTPSPRLPSSTTLPPCP